MTKTYEQIKAEQEAAKTAGEVDPKSTSGAFPHANPEDRYAGVNPTEPKPEEPKPEEEKQEPGPPEQQPEPPPAEPAPSPVSEKTKAEMEAGRQAVQQREKVEKENGSS